MPPPEVLLITEMIDAAREACRLVRDQSVEQLNNDRQRRDALLWNFTVLGEAAAQLPSDFKKLHSEIDWVRPARLRNRIVHGYWSADMSILAATANNDLPEYAQQLQLLLEILTHDQ